METTLWPVSKAYEPRLIAKDGGGVSITTSDMVIFINRLSDDFYWDGSAFTNGTRVSNAMAKVGDAQTPGQWFYDLDISGISANDIYIMEAVDNNGFAIGSPFEEKLIADGIVKDIADTLVDTNEIQGKLPDNNFMGSSVTTNKDDEIDAILADTAVIEPLVSTNLDTTISSRSDFDETTDPVELLDTGGTAGTSAEELVDDIYEEAAAGHVTAGSFGKLFNDDNQNITTTMTAAVLARKALLNRLEVSEASTGNMVLYDDNNDVLLTGTVKDKDDNGILIGDNTPAKRTKLST